MCIERGLVRVNPSVHVTTALPDRPIDGSPIAVGAYSSMGPATVAAARKAAPNLQLDIHLGPLKLCLSLSRKQKKRAWTRCAVCDTTPRGSGRARRLWKRRVHEGRD